MRKWFLHKAETQFGAMLDACLTEGPQLVTRHGIDTAVLVRVDEWDRLRATAHPSLKQLLLAEGARCIPIAPPRAKASRRTTAARR
jgi:antitoxin Phd